jgi:hypothetical protein
VIEVPLTATAVIAPVYFGVCPVSINMHTGRLLRAHCANDCCTILSTLALSGVLSPSVNWV